MDDHVQLTGVGDSPSSLSSTDHQHTRTDATLHLGDLRIDMRERRAVLRGCDLALTPTESRLLAELASDPGHLFDYCVLAEQVLSYRCDEGDARATLRVHVMNLRRKLEEDPQSPRYIVCVRGAGYRFSRPEEADGPGAERLPRART